MFCSVSVVYWLCRSGWVLELLIVVGEMVESVVRNGCSQRAAVVDKMSA
jgi:hypothetical protein